MWAAIIIYNLLARSAGGATAHTTQGRSRNQSELVGSNVDRSKATWHVTCRKTFVPNGIAPSPNGIARSYRPNVTEGVPGVRYLIKTSSVRSFFDLYSSIRYDARSATPSLPTYLSRWHGQQRQKRVAPKATYLKRLCTKSYLPTYRRKFL